MSFSRSLASARFAGISPRAANRSTWNTSRGPAARLVETYCSGVFETRPPSQ
jgi:hypothetical protein